MKKCNVCETRKADNTSELCTPCYEESGWENTHSDSSHEKLTEIATKAVWVVGGVFKTGAVELRKLAPQVGIKNAGQHKSTELRRMILDKVVAEQTGCWICHPELNEAANAKPSKKRAAATGERPSRKGQKINVPLRAPGELKAAVVAKAAPEAQVETERGGTVRLDLTTPSFVLVLAWDVEGRYDYDRAVAVVAGRQRKVRNVAEALRMIAEIGL